jgi:hypothetical protein
MDRKPAQQRNDRNQENHDCKLVANGELAEPFQLPSPFAGRARPRRRELKRNPLFFAASELISNKIREPLLKKSIITPFSA